VHEDRIIGGRLRKRVGHVALFVALAVVPVLAFNSLATADTGSDGGSDPTGARPALGDTQRQCLADQGVTLPSRTSSDGKPPLTREERRQLRAASEACGLRGLRARPERGLARGLTDEQRQCLADQDVPRRQAAEACGLPAHGHHGIDGTI
jgi:hypothetical protein